MTLLKITAVVTTLALSLTQGVSATEAPNTEVVKPLIILQLTKQKMM